MNSEVEKIIVMSEKESEIRIAILENGELVELFFEDIEEASKELRSGLPEVKE